MAQETTGVSSAWEGDWQATNVPNMRTKMEAMTMYVAQLLPDETQARVLRKAMVEWLNEHSNDNMTPESEVVAMHALYAKFVEDVHRHNEREAKEKLV